jgi:hypothetical protein
MLAGQTALDALDFQGFHSRPQLEVDTTNVFENEAFEIPRVAQVCLQIFEINLC